MNKQDVCNALGIEMEDAHLYDVEDLVYLNIEDIAFLEDVEHRGDDMLMYPREEYNVMNVKGIDFLVKMGHEPTLQSILDIELRINIMERDFPLPEEHYTIKEYLLDICRLDDFTGGDYDVVDLNNSLIRHGVLPIQNKYAKIQGKYYTFEDIVRKAQEESMDVECYAHELYLYDTQLTGQTFSQWTNELQGFSK